MTNEQTLRAWVRGNECPVNNNKTIIGAGAKVYSYGAHYILGMRYNTTQTICVNNRKYSTTTSRHASLLERIAEQEGYKVKRERL